MAKRPAFMRPAPPEQLDRFLPAPELLAWVEQTILASGGALYNPDHAHLVDADLAFLWAPAAFEKAGRTVLRKHPCQVGTV